MAGGKLRNLGKYCMTQMLLLSDCNHFLSRVDELYKLACLQCTDLHTSAGRVLQRERRGHGFESRRSPENLFFSDYFAIA